jgi:hypothetical protein
MSADYNEEAYENASVNVVNTDLEAGFEFKFIIDPKTKDEKDKQFLPTKSGDKYFIPFLPGKK